MEDREKKLLTDVLHSLIRACRINSLEVYIVGGFPRDKILNRTCSDLDILVTNGDPWILADFLHKKECFHRPVVFKRFGTFRVGRDGIDVEIVKLRDKDIRGDLLHRDFTINTLLMKILPAGLGEIEDILETGVKDIQHGILRTPGNPEDSILEDPVRMMRAFRFEAVLGFKIVPELEHTIKSLSSFIKKSPPERIRDEFIKILLSKGAGKTLERLHNSGILIHILPELDMTYGFDQHSPYHHEDLFHHTLSTIDRSSLKLEIRLAALFHDLGKMEAQQVMNDRIVHYGHQDISVEKAKKALRRLRFQKRLIETVIFLVKHHMVQYNSEWSDSAVKRFVRKMGTKLEPILNLLEADWGSLKHKENFNLLTELNERIKKLKIEEIVKIKSPINGYEIQKILGIPAGPDVGRAKEAIINAIMDNTIPSTPSAAKKFLIQNREKILKVDTESK